MAFFNKPLTQKQRIRQYLTNHPRRTVNYEGGIAFKPEPEMDLYLRVASSMMADGFYNTSTDALAEIQQLIRSGNFDRSYVLALANYARNKLYLRTVSHILFAEGARLYADSPNEPKPDVIRQAWNVINRPDDAGEILAYYKLEFGRTFPHALLKGIGNAMTKFDEYQLAKYNRPAQFKLRDIVRLTHPPKHEKFRKLLDGTLPTPKTWEVEVAGKGNNAEIWNDVASRMGTFALLRNLRNFEKAGAEGAIRVAIETFNNPSRVLKSGILPFRWFEATKRVTRSDIHDGLRAGLENSIVQLPSFDGDMAILVDGSGSMLDPIGGKSKSRRYEIAAILAAILVKKITGNVDVISFSHIPRQVQVSKRDSVITTARNIANAAEFVSTYTHLAIEALDRKYDYVVIISDEEGYSDRQPRPERGVSSAEAWMEYVAKYGKTKLFSINTAGYGTVQFPQDLDGVIQVGGFSENILHMLKAIEDSRDAVAEIKQKWSKGYKGTVVDDNEDQS